MSGQKLDSNFLGVRFAWECQLNRMSGQTQKIGFQLGGYSLLGGANQIVCHGNLECKLKMP